MYNYKRIATNKKQMSDPEVQKDSNTNTEGEGDGLQKERTGEGKIGQTQTVSLIPLSSHLPSLSLFH